MANRDRLVRDAYALLTSDSQGPSPEDHERIDAAVAGKIADLSRRQVIYIADLNDFEDAYLEYLAILVAASLPLSKNFGVQPSVEEINFAEMRLRAMNADAETNEPIRFLSY